MTSNFSKIISWDACNPSVGSDMIPNIMITMIYGQIQTLAHLKAVGKLPIPF